MKLGEGETVEDALAKALAASGGMSPSNATELRKVGWSRSSRTDKGAQNAGSIARRHSSSQHLLPHCRTTRVPQAVPCNILYSRCTSSVSPEQAF